MKLSSTGPQSTLPSFFFMAGGEEGGSLFGGVGWTGLGSPSPFHMPAAATCPDEFYAHESPDLRVPQLPWRLQNDWGCEREPTHVDVVILENEFLRAAITPQWGSKIWSLYHKKEERQLVYNNPAHQPSNIGYRKAWTSGGIEWNWAPGRIGHSVFSESPSYMATLQTEKGPVVRAWEYDRQNHSVWSVDILLDQDVLWAHPRIYNTETVEIPGYWWTCVAMRTTDRTRIIAPAELSVSPCTPWPHGAWDAPNVTFRGVDAFGSQGCATTRTCAYQNDESYLGNIPHSHDFFMYVTPGRVPHITHVSEDGYTVVHSHPPHMRGTKFFQWGKDLSGQFMQDFMSGSDYMNPKCEAEYYDPWCEQRGPREGDYTELQVGPAPTQMHTFPIAANSTYEWSEFFKGFNADAGRIHGQNYTDAVAHVDEWLNSSQGLDQTKFEEMDRFFNALARVAVEQDDIVATGMPWGGMREKLAGAPLVPHGACPFPEPEYNEETRQWLDLMVNGTFSDETLALTPVNFEVDAKWVQMLEASMAAHGATWLHHLFIGTYELEVGNARAANASFRASLALKPSAHAYRNLAVFAPTADAASELFHRGWAAFASLPATDPSAADLGKDLASEISAWLMLNERWQELGKFLKGLADHHPAHYATRDRVLHAQAALDVHNKDYEAAIKILTSECFPTYGSERQALINLWWDSKLMEAVAENGGNELTMLQTIHLRRKLGCDGDTTSTTVTSDCTRGPPNLGLRYGGF
eukprot:g5888.t1